MASRSTLLCFQFQKSGTCSYGPRCRYSHSPLTTSRSPATIKMRKTRKAFTRNRPSHLREFFADYPDFDYDPSASTMSEFWRLCDFKCWDKEDWERENARDNLKDAMVLQFNDIYGTDVDDIDAWQRLCIVLDISPVPEELAACREVVRSTHVNLVDLMDGSEHDEPFEIFGTVAQLSSYTISTGKYFPKENAYAGGVLKYLLREILNPHRTHDHHRQAKGRRGGRRT